MRRPHQTVAEKTLDPNSPIRLDENSIGLILASPPDNAAKLRNPSRKLKTQLLLLMKPNKSTWPEYVRNGLGWKLSKLGEYFGISSWTYNKRIFEYFHFAALENAPKVVKYIAEEFSGIKTVVDVGCGSGAFVAEFLRQGYEGVGCENSAYGRKVATDQGVHAVSFDLSLNPPAKITGPFDLAYSFEVAEHLPPQLGDNLVKFMTGLSDLVVFSAAYPGQKGIGHINEQPMEYWIEKFKKLNFHYDSPTSDRLRTKFKQSGTSDWFVSNTAVFRKLQ